MLINYEVWYTGKNNAAHKLRNCCDYLENVLQMVKNPGVVRDNKRKLNGLNNLCVMEYDCDDIKGNYIIQLSGYNGNVGMYCYLAQPDGSIRG